MSGEELRDPIWDPVIQEWQEEAYYGDSSPVSSSNSAAFNQKKAESYVHERDGPPDQQAASSNRELLGRETPNSPEQEVSPSTEL